MIESIFNNKNNIFYGHGTGTKIGGSDEITSNIFLKGLRCCNNSPTIYYTSVCFGEGSDNLFSKERETLNNWRHKDSKNIIIVSVPKNYVFTPHILGRGIEYYRESAFCYCVKENEKNKEEHFYLRPEFVKGFYDASNDRFVENKGYYENLKAEEQDALFKEVKERYIQTIYEKVDVIDSPLSERLKNMEESGDKDYCPPLSEDEIEEIDNRIVSLKILEEYKKQKLELDKCIEGEDSSNWFQADPENSLDDWN